MPQCQFLFSAIFGFKKAVLQISSELDETKCHVPIFPTCSRSPKERRRGAPRRRPHPMARVGPLARRHVGSEPRASTDVAPSPIYSPRGENPKHPSLHPRKVPEPPLSSTLAREGSEALPGTLLERGIITGGLYITMPASVVMRE